jgi:hypothetical protein
MGAIFLNVLTLACMLRLTKKPTCFGLTLTWRSMKKWDIISILTTLIYSVNWWALVNYVALDVETCDTKKWCLSKTRVPNIGRGQLMLIKLQGIKV